MGVGELIEQIRLLYVTNLSEVLAARQAVSAEPVATSEAGEISRRGTLKLASRHDGVVSDAAGAEVPFVVDSEGVLGFEDISFDWGEDLKVCLTPFCWDFARFEVPNAGAKDLTDNLVDWFERWFTRPETPAGELAGVVHSLSDVHSGEVHSSFQVDFGSAPLACFEDLLDVLGASRVRSVTVQVAD